MVPRSAVTKTAWATFPAQLAAPSFPTHTHDVGLSCFALQWRRNWVCLDFNFLWPNYKLSWLR